MREKFGYIGLAGNLDVEGVTPPEINKVRNMGKKNIYNMIYMIESIEYHHLSERWAG